LLAQVLQVVMVAAVGTSAALELVERHSLVTAMREVAPLAQLQTMVQVAAAVLTELESLELLPRAVTAVLPQHLPSTAPLPLALAAAGDPPTEDLEP
jgi:hypothetical protein